MIQTQTGLPNWGLNPKVVKKIWFLFHEPGVFLRMARKKISHPIRSFAVWLCYTQVEVIFITCQSRLANDLFWSIGHSKKNDALQLSRLSLKKSAASISCLGVIFLGSSCHDVSCEEAQEAMWRVLMEENEIHWSANLAELPVRMWMRSFWTFQPSQDPNQHYELELPDQLIEKW